VCLVGAAAEGDLGLGEADIVQVDAGMIDEHFEQLGLPSLLSDLEIDTYVNTTFSVPALKTTRHQVSFIHDVVFEDRPELVEPGLCEYLQRSSRFAASHADRVITVSEHSRRRICAVYGLEPERVAVVRNGVTKPEAMPTEGHVEDARARLGVSRPYVLYVGSLEPKKGIPELLEAFARLTADGFTGQLVLAGGKAGPPYDVDAHVATHGITDRVNMLGYVSEEDKQCLMAGCELFVYPSRYEGFGLPPLEALAFGKPCVVTDATSLPEVVGDCALMARSEDTESLTETMKRGLADAGYREHAREAGPAWAAEFTWERAAREFLDVLDSLETN